MQLLLCAVLVLVEVVSKTRRRGRQETGSAWAERDEANKGHQPRSHEKWAEDGGGRAPAVRAPRCVVVFLSGLGSRTSSYKACRPLFSVTKPRQTTEQAAVALLFLLSATRKPGFHAFPALFFNRNNPQCGQATEAAARSSSLRLGSLGGPWYSVGCGAAGLVSPVLVRKQGGSPGSQQHRRPKRVLYDLNARSERRTSLTVPNYRCPIPPTFAFQNI